ncbi:MAG: hypothetical protein AB1571_04185 [Nanoarchaeota archaeon]
MKKNEIKRVSVVVIVVVLVLMFSIGFIVYRNYLNVTKDVYIYKGINGETYTFQRFILENNTFHAIRVYAEVNGETKEYKYPLHYGPYEVEDIPIESNLDEKILKKWIYLTQDPELVNKSNGRSMLAVLEIGRITGTADYGLYQINTQAAYTMESDVKVPVKTCKDASDKVGIIEIRMGSKDAVYSENECVIVEGKDEQGLIKAADKLTLHLLGVF